MKKISTIMKIVTVVGARPQFIKSAIVSRELRKIAKEVVVHTGQHYDDNMSGIFFRDLGMETPHYNLGIGSASHGAQTGEMLKKIEEVLLAEKPDYVLVYGDTNSTLAGALAASKLHIPLAHVEAGLRCFNKKVPEEVNRILTDHASNLLLCPTMTAVKNLQQEGLTEGIHLVGDVMYDAVLCFLDAAEKHSHILEQLKLSSKGYALATVHRAENTDDEVRFQSIFLGLEKISREGLPVIVPLHPRSLKKIKSLDVSFNSLRFIEPLPYGDMLVLEKHSKVILTDSGGVQKEAHFFQVPCLTLREETEWLETVETGWNTLVGTDFEKIFSAVQNLKTGMSSEWPYGNGSASQKIRDLLIQRPCLIAS